MKIEHQIKANYIITKNNKANTSSIRTFINILLYKTTWINTAKLPTNKRLLLTTKGINPEIYDRYKQQKYLYLKKKEKKKILPSIFPHLSHSPSPDVI